MEGWSLCNIQGPEAVPWEGGCFPPLLKVKEGDKTRKRKKKNKGVKVFLRYKVKWSKVCFA